MQGRPKIPRPTVKRLSLYLREVEGQMRCGADTIRSRQLAGALGVTDAQVRKDLAYFGQFGQAGVGYRTADLFARLRSILGVDRTWNTAVVGVGNIGRALMAYEQFRRKGFEIVAAFDRAAEIVGRSVGGHEVHPIESIGALVPQREIKIGIVAVPAESAQEVADLLVEAGVAGILNFAPRRLEVTDRVTVVSVDFSVALEQLAFEVSLGSG